MPSLNLSISMSSLANDFTTLMPDRLSSALELISATFFLFSLKALRIFLLRRKTNANMNGSMMNAAAVRYPLIPLSMMNAPIILIREITIFSGP